MRIDHKPNLNKSNKKLYKYEAGQANCVKCNRNELSIVRKYSSVVMYSSSMRSALSLIQRKPKANELVINKKLIHWNLLA